MARLDYKKVLALCTMEELLRRYEISATRRINDARLEGDCPLPSHRSQAEGTFSVDTEMNRWRCTADSCKPAFGGDDRDIVDFVAAIKGCMRPEAARWLLEWYGPSSIGTRANDPPKKSAPSQGATPRKSILFTDAVLIVDASGSRVIRVDAEEH